MSLYHEGAAASAAPQSAQSKGSFRLTPKQGHALLAAALDLVSYPSPQTHKRVRDAVEGGTTTAYPTVAPEDLVRLVDVLETIIPGASADLSAQRYERRRGKR